MGVLRVGRVGAAAFALGISLAGPDTVAVAVADTGGETSTVSTGPAESGTDAGASNPRRAERRGAARTEATAARTRQADTSPRRAAARSARPAATQRPQKPTPATSLAPAAVTRASTVAPPALAQVLARPGAVAVPVPAAARAVARQSAAPAVSATAQALPSSAPVTPNLVATVQVGVAQIMDRVADWLSELQTNPVSSFLSGTLLLVRRTLLPNVPRIPQITVTSVSAPEDDTDAVFTVTLDKASDVEVTLAYSTSAPRKTPTGPHPATPGQDFSPVSGFLTFAPGQTSGQIGVPVLSDDVVEPDEAFAVNVYATGARGTATGLALGAGRGTILDGGFGAGVGITIPELDSPSSAYAIRVNPAQQDADAIKLTAGTTISLTLPGPSSDYTLFANKQLVNLTLDPTSPKVDLTAQTPGFLGLQIKPNDGSPSRYLGVYIADQTGVVPDVTTVNGNPPLGTVALTNGTGDQFLEKANYRPGVAPIDYLYIYDQGGADYTDGNLTGLLSQAARHGMVPVVVYYNIQAVDKGTSASSAKTGIVEGYNSAYQAVNEYNWADSKQTDKTMFTGYMTRYFQKLKKDFATMESVGVPVQVVMEPDFLGYMAVNSPDFVPPYPFVPNIFDRTLNTAKVDQPMRDAGLLTPTDPSFEDTIAGMVSAINYYVGKTTTNIRMGWKTNIWSVPDQKVNSLGLLHVTDTTCTSTPCDYPWQFGWVKPVGWDQGRDYIKGQATQLGAFLQKVGVTSWTTGKPERAPFLAIDKYGVDGAYTYDPTMLTTATTSAAFGDLGFLIFAAFSNCTTSPCQDPNTFGFTDAAVQKYFGLADRKAFLDFYTKYKDKGYDKTASDVQTVFTTLQNAAKSDPNIAKWFFNADHWSNYLYLVDNLSTTLGGTKVMLWQIPQGHINGSTAGRDLANTDALYEDSATSFFFGDTFTPTGQYAADRLKYFSADDAPDTNVTVQGNTITWGEHMTLAGKSGALSVLFGAGLGLSTRGSPTPAGDTTDQDFWFDQATKYLTASN